MKLPLCLSAIFVYSFFSIEPALSVTWDGGGIDNLASTDANWTANFRPQHGDNIYFDATSSKDCTWDLTGMYSHNSLTIEGGYTGTVTVDSSLTLINALTVPDTGQTGCYDSGGSQVGCYTFGQGQDAYYYTNTMSFTDKGDGTITDNVTGLEWQKCTYGLSGADCGTGSAVGSDWATALTLCAGLGAGWRLPEDFELADLADHGTYGPSIDTASFPNTQSNYYWTPNAYPYSAGGFSDLYPYIVSFDSGVLSYGAQDSSYFVRCVRGTRAAKGTAFTDNGDGTIMDISTGLLWQKCSYGQTNDAGCSGAPTPRTWDQALTDCEGLFFAGLGNWRLPDIKELNSMSDTALHPAINNAYFPNSLGGTWWSSTTSRTTTSALGLSIYVGSMVNSDKGTTNYVRCVQGL